MRLGDAVGLAASNLWKNPVRTLLTILGLGVGIAAVMTVLTLGSAGEKQVEVQIARLGVDKVWITPEENSALQPNAGEAIAAHTDLSACAGAVTMGAVKLGEEMTLAQICGYDAGFSEVYGPVLEAGRLFLTGEYGGSAVALVSSTLAESLGGNVLGRRVDVGSRKVKIIGIVSGMQVQAAAASNGIIILPLQTFLDTYAGGAVGEVTVTVPGGARAEEVGAAAVAALGEGFAFTSLQEEIDAARSVVRIFVMVLACVAAVCMLTGGIGVMNILLVSVRERRREIGLMKAIGATAGQIGLMFLLESACYALLGGVLGIMLGMGLIGAFGRWIGLEAALELPLALGTLAVAGLAGIVFGVVPALRAAGMIPVAALKKD